MELPLLDRKPRVILADDTEAILRAVTLRLADRFDLVGVCRDGSAAFQATLELCPDVLVLDIMMPVMNGIQVARCLQIMKTESKIVMLTAMEDPEYSEAARAAGVRGFVLKQRMAADLLHAIEVVLDGGVFITFGPGPKLTHARRPSATSQSPPMGRGW